MGTLNTEASLTSYREGLRLSVYFDELHNATLGYGIAVSSPNGLTEDEAVFLLLYRIFKIRAELVRQYSADFITLSSDRQAILVDCAYNMGLGNFHRELGPNMSGDALLLGHVIGQCNAAKINPERYASNATSFVDDTLPVAVQTFDLSPGILELVNA